MYDRDNDIDRLFREDSRDKKRTAVGIHHRASRKGYIRGGIKTPSDFLSAKEKKKLNGEVRIYSMYDKYKDLANCNMKEILSKDDNDIKNILTVIKENNTCKDIYTHFKFSNGKLYGYYKKYGVEINPKPHQLARGGYGTAKADSVPNLKTKAQFNLMDSYAKGEYAEKILSKYRVSMQSLADKYEIPKATLGYYISRYRKKTAKKQSQDETKQLEMATEMPIQEIEVINDPKVDELNDTKMILEETNKKILELEETNKKLSDRLLEFTMNENTTSSKFKIEVNGEYNKEDLSKRLLSLDYLTMDDKSYRIKMLLEEV